MTTSLKALIILTSSPCAADLSVPGSHSVHLYNTPSITTPKHPKRPRDTFEIKASEKRRKLIGRPTGWTASRRQKLVRLYLFTELTVPEGFADRQL